MKKCPNCGKISDRKFCTDCGYNLETVKMSICPNCGREVDSKFCPDCGASMEYEPNKEMIDRYYRSHESSVHSVITKAEDLVDKFKAASTKKKALIIGAAVLCLVLLLQLSNNSQSTGSYTKSTSSTKTYERDASDVSQELIKLLVADAIYDKIDENYPGAVPGDTRYSIATIERKTSSIEVYGTATTYDKYGKILDYDKNFTIVIDVPSTGTPKVKSCMFSS